MTAQSSWKHLFLVLLFYLENFIFLTNAIDCTCTEFALPGIYFTGDVNSYFLYNSSCAEWPSIGVSYTWDMEFSTNATNGVILFSYGDISIRQDFLAIYMENGYLKHSINNFDATATVTTSLRYNDGAFHRAQFIKSRNIVNMTVDDETLQMETGTSSSGVNSDGQYYFGGLKNSQIASKAVDYLGTGLDVSFQGCFRFVTLNGACLVNPVVNSQTQACNTVPTECQLTTDEYVLCGDSDSTECQCYQQSCCWDIDRNLCYHSNNTIYHNGVCTYRQAYSISDGFASTCNPPSVWATSNSQDGCLSEACGLASDVNAVNLVADSSCFFRTCNTNSDGSVSDLELSTSAARDIWVTVVNYCDGVTCNNGGSCVRTNASYICSCPSGYNGSLCETDVNECVSSPCNNGGSCEDGANSYTCVCVGGYTGTHCDTDLNECENNGCENNSTCVDQVNGYICDCSGGYTGTSCETDINECQSSPCDNGGTCDNQFNGYVCSCVTGYTGTNCQTDIDECESSPCDNSAPCQDQVNSFVCNCITGYTGVLCETDINECENISCYNGTCVDQVNGYVCNCLTGYTGTLCESESGSSEGDLQQQLSDSGSSQSTTAAAVSVPVLVVSAVAVIVTTAGIYKYMKYKKAITQTAPEPTSGEKYVTHNSNSSSELSPTEPTTNSEDTQLIKTQTSCAQKAQTTIGNSKPIPPSSPAKIMVAPATAQATTNYAMHTSDIDGLASHAPSINQAAVYHGNDFVPNYSQY